jgi:hypothetical protein
MAQRSLSERLSLAVQDAIYKVADDLTTVVDEALEAFEDAAKMVEEKVTPVYNVTVNGQPLDVVNAIKEEVDRQRAKHAPVEPGGRDDSQSLERERLLRELYRYMSTYRVEGYTDHVQSAEDNSAGVTEHRWVPANLVDHFLAHVVKEFGPPPAFRGHRAEEGDL